MSTDDVTGFTMRNGGTTQECEEQEDEFGYDCYDNAFLIESIDMSLAGWTRICAVLFFEDGNAPMKIDESPCTQSWTKPTPTASGYVLDTSGPYSYVYTVGSATDLVIEWAGANNGGCDFSSSLDVDASNDLPNWLSHDRSRTSLRPGFTA